MSAAPEKTNHDNDVAANGPDFLDRNFEQGGLLPLLGRIGGLALGVVAQAPIAAIRGRGEPAAADPHAKPHDPHKKDEAKKEEGKEGEVKEGESKKDEKKEGDHAQEKEGDWFAAMRSSGAVVDDLVKGKVDKHTLEHAVDHWLDARDLGKARPFAGLIASGVQFGLGKIFKFRDHALEELKPEWETLGRQILTGLKKDPKHGYHGSVENLCHTMKEGEVEDNFGKFIEDAPFEAAMKTEKGREALQKQIGRITGQTDQPHPLQLQKRIDGILQILSLEHEEEEGAWAKLKGFLGFKKAAPAAHGHGHSLDDKGAQKNLVLLRETLKRMKAKGTEGNLRMIYEGKRQKIDYDKFGDQVDEGVEDGDESRISFMASFQETSFRNKFKALLDPARVKVKAKTPEGREELRELLKALFDLEAKTKLKATDLEGEIGELMGPHGKLKEEKDYPEDKSVTPHKDTPARANFKSLQKLIETIQKNMADKSPDHNDKPWVEVVYEDKFDVTYDKFGFQLKDLDAEKAAAYLGAYKSDKFGDQFRLITDAATLLGAVQKEETRKQAQAELLNFLGLPPGPVQAPHIDRTLTRWKTFFSMANVDTQGQKYKEWEADVESITNVVKGQLLTDLCEGPKKPFAVEVGEDIGKVIKQFNIFTFESSYGYLMSGADMRTATPEIKAAIKAQVEQFFGQRPPNPEQRLNTLISKFGEYKNTEDAVVALTQIKSTLTPTFLDEVYKPAVVVAPAP